VDTEHVPRQHSRGSKCSPSCVLQIIDGVQHFSLPLAGHLKLIITERVVFSISLVQTVFHSNVLMHICQTTIEKGVGKSSRSDAVEASKGTTGGVIEGVSSGSSIDTSAGNSGAKSGGGIKPRQADVQIGHGEDCRLLKELGVFFCFFFFLVFWVVQIYVMIICCIIFVYLINKEFSGTTSSYTHDKRI